MVSTAVAVAHARAQGALGLAASDAGGQVGQVEKVAHAGLPHVRGRDGQDRDRHALQVLAARFRAVITTVV